MLSNLQCLKDKKMAGTIIVDRIESDASYASTINVANRITFSNTVNFGVTSGAPVAGFYSPSTNNLAFTTASTERMRIDSVGNVGIGSSPASTNRLQVSSSGSTRLLVENTTNTVSLRIQTETASGLVQTDTNHPLNFATNNGAVSMQIDTSGNLKFNSGYGTAATAYGCRAWVNFNGIGTVSIRASGNVSSITDNNTGDYTVNFTNAMPDADYCVNVSTPNYISNNGSIQANIYGHASTVGSPALQSTTQIRVAWCSISGTAQFYDPSNYYVSIFR